jgi:hypothetical protein
MARAGSCRPRATGAGEQIPRSAHTHPARTGITRRLPRNDFPVIAATKSTKSRFESRDDHASVPARRGRRAQSVDTGSNSRPEGSRARFRGPAHGRGASKTGPPQWNVRSCGNVGESRGRSAAADGSSRRWGRIGEAPAATGTRKAVGKVERGGASHAASVVRKPAVPGPARMLFPVEDGRRRPGHAATLRSGPRRRGRIRTHCPKMNFVRTNIMENRTGDKGAAPYPPRRSPSPAWRPR